MAKKKTEDTPLLYIKAFAAGLAAELLGIRLEELFMMFNISSDIGFWISLVLFISIPYLTCGLIIYRATGDVMKALYFSALVIPVTLIIL